MEAGSILSQMWSLLKMYFSLWVGLVLLRKHLSDSRHTFTLIKCLRWLFNSCYLSSLTWLPGSSTQESVSWCYFMGWSFKWHRNSIHALLCKNIVFLRAQHLVYCDESIKNIWQRRRCNTWFPALMGSILYRCLFLLLQFGDYSCCTYYDNLITIATYYYQPEVNNAKSSF